MTAALLYVLLCGAIYYLGSRAKITQPIWSRYPKWLDGYMLCSACFGFAIGFACALVFRFDFFGLPGHAWYTPIVVGLCGIVWTPMVAALQLGALDSEALAPKEDGK